MIFFLKIVYGFFKFLKIPEHEKQLTIFIEKKSDLLYFNRFLTDTYKTLNIKILIFSSELYIDNEVGKQSYLSNVIYVGNGFCRFLYFKLIKTKIFLMTTPDLENSELKKSINKVEYFYLFHSIVSSHMVYNQYAFNNYDYILTVGPHHDVEIKHVEQYYKLRKKKIVPFGYPWILDLKKEYLINNLKKTIKRKNQKTVLIAPTWGKSSITEQCIEKIFNVLIKEKYKIIFRPHPETLKRRKILIDSLVEKYKDYICFELNIGNTQYINEVDILISDWSGFALEFFLISNKTTLFIDTPPKINNISFDELRLAPLEKTIRSKIGQVVPINEIYNLVEVIEKNVKNKKNIINKSDFIYDYEQKFTSIMDIFTRILKNDTL